MTLKHADKHWPISIKWVSIVCLALVFLSVFQDYYQSIRNQSAFYISESLLFNSFWLFFIPGLHTLFSILQFFHQKGWPKFPTAIIGTVLFHWCLYALAIYSISFLFHEHTYSLMHTMKYSVSTLSLSTLLIYGIGVVIYSRRSTHPIEYPSRIQVKTGSQVVPIDVSNIISIQSEAPYVAIYTEEKQYLHSETLKSLEEQLDPTSFVRIHKSCIINLTHVRSYSSRNNGDYDVVMENEMTVRVSRNYAAAFKSRL